MRKSNGTSKIVVETLSDLSKVTGYKINVQKSIVFLYAGKEQLEIEIFRNAIYNSINKSEILGDNSDKRFHYLQKLHNIPERNERGSKWRYILCSGVTRFTILKMSVLPKFICIFNTIAIKISRFFSISVFWYKLTNSF